MMRGRLGIISAIIVSLLAAGLMRGWAAAWQNDTTAGRAVNSQHSFGSMDSFTLALLLGGLRGPLVMFLWSTSENQKVDRDLEDFDTKVEWIRLLQPEFDTVHLFQIWNKAYNISAMLASPANKYVTILQALDYARSIDQERPNDVNILGAIAQIYSNKLAGAVQEKAFYVRQFREESMAPQARDAAYPDGASFRRLDRAGNYRLLGDQGLLLPRFLQPSRPRPAGLPPGAEWNDGAALQYLQTYQPFPYGVSPVAMGYNYSKRAQVCVTADEEKPLQLSPMVVDSRPALSLRDWTQEEMDRGLLAEAQAFGIPAESSAETDLRMASLKPAEPPVDQSGFDAAIYSYSLAVRLAQDARHEYERHLAHPDFVNRLQTYASHLDDLTQWELASKAERDFLLARTASGAERQRLLDAARENYDRTVLQCKRILLKYYVEDPIVALTYPHGVTRSGVGKLSDGDIEQIYQRVKQVLGSGRVRNEEFADERMQYAIVMRRALARLAVLQ